MASLAKFDISPRGEEFLLRLADDSGQVVSTTDNRLSHLTRPRR